VNGFIIVGLLGILLPSIGYPILMGLVSALRRPSGSKLPDSKLPDSKLTVESQLPSVSFILSAYNEGAVLREKLLNTLSLNYPREKLDVMVLSDASSDQTDQIAREFADRGIRLMRSESRIGKSENLTRFVPESRGSILVFTDANSIYHTDAILRLVSHFDDPKVGYVVGAQRYLSRQKHAEHDSENQYWELELKLKEWESNISSVVGADGAIFAMRKELFEPLGASDINDFLGPLKIIQRGYRGVFDPQAVCFEAPVSSMQRNFFRKVRIITRSLQAVGKVPSVLLPWRTGWFAFQVWFHKVLRWFSPVFILLLLIGAIVDVSHGGGQGKVILALFLAWIALSSLYLIPAFRRVSLISSACYGLVINAAALVGILLAFTGRSINTWKPDR
jgi:cellulose synthase/poly-beta-1,6-N-acetylglucosamine synthase-like glycosyltransferase